MKFKTGEQYLKERYGSSELKVLEKEVDEKLIIMRLYETRKSLDMTQEELAKKAGVPRSTISRIETGKLNVTINTLKLIGKALGRNVEVNFV